VKTGVGIMARAPSAVGKTRLAPHLSAVRLRALRTALLADTLQALHDLPNTIVYFTPDEADPEMASLCGAAIARVAQGGGDLGARMRRAIHDLVETRKYDAAILIGSDIPWLRAQHVRRAADLLQGGADLVLGPADDGGYYLIGMRRVQAPLFEGIEWGTSSVLHSTLRTAQQIGVNVQLVQREYDVDTFADLSRLQRELDCAESDACPHLRQWFSES
jgi:rSAM/selenodomain-associated transferase 1